MRRHPFAVLLIAAGLAFGWLVPQAASTGRLPSLAGPVYSVIAGGNLTAAEAAVSASDAYSLSPESASRLAADLGGKLTVARAPSTGPMVVSDARSGGYVGLAVLGGRCRAAAVGPHGRPIPLRGLPAAGCSGAAALARRGR